MKALREEMIERFDQIDERFDQIDGRFDQIDERFDQIDERFEQVEGGFAAVTEQLVEQRAYTEFGYDRLDKTLHALGGGLARLERKLDRILALSVESRGRNRQ